MPQGSACPLAFTAHLCGHDIGEAERRPLVRRRLADDDDPNHLPRQPHGVRPRQRPCEEGDRVTRTFTRALTLTLTRIGTLAYTLTYTSD